MDSLHDQAIILQQMPYQERSQIVTLFTEQNGMVRGIFRRSGRKTGESLSPMTWVEAVYLPGRTGGLAAIREIKVLDPFLALRKELKFLEGGCELIKAILLSQEEQHPATALFHLLAYLFRHMTQVEDPRLLVACLRLKILRYEGVLSEDLQCVECRAPIQETLFWAEGVFCGAHAPWTTLPFSRQEGEWIQTIAFGRSLRYLQSLRAPSSFFEKVKEWFFSMVDQKGSRGMIRPS